MILYMVFLRHMHKLGIKRRESHAAEPVEAKPTKRTVKPKKQPAGKT